ncbi:MAG: DEAD/DEAH box helicase, partial [Limisphaerales bacterium]
MNKSLPIWQIHSEIVETLRAGNQLVLIAPTGSGKTTQVPQMLLEESLKFEVSSLKADAVPSSGLRVPRSKIVVLQPRRVAARTVAARVAWERNSKLGEEVGYQIRFHDFTSLGTRICFITEGILLRWLQDDRALADVGIILFDEFHERNLLSDVSLALVKQLQETARPDLKIAVMSATLDAEPVAKYLNDCPILISEGQSFPIEIQYLDHHDNRPVSQQAADVVERIVNGNHPGDILVFMPGMGEINATINALRAICTLEDLALIPLHGELPPDEQDRAFALNPLRKIVVSTNVAETSVTIDGIRHVVDSGVARVARYDAERGIGTLFIEEISRASADQRKGRAGRTAPGMCHRLWTESGNLNRPARNTPEIQRTDLAEVVLLLHSLGIKKANEFDWLDKPDPQAVERAEKLLQMLGALENCELRISNDELKTTPEKTRNFKLKTSNSDLTSIGRQMLRLPMHPRYSRMLVEAAKFDCAKAAALCAALVSGRDLLMRLGRDDKHISEARELFEASQDSDFYTLMRAFQFAKKNNFNVEQCRRYGIHAQTAQQIEQTFEQILGLVENRRSRVESKNRGDESATQNSKLKTQNSNDDSLLRCIMTGFIDQLCIRRDSGTLECDLTEGRHGTLIRESVVQNAKLFVAASLRG